MPGWSGAGGQDLTPPAPRRRQASRRQFLATAALLAGIGIVLWAVLGSRGAAPLPPLPRPASASAPGPASVIDYSAARADAFISRATAGEAHPLYIKSPGGVLATAARVARFRPLINRLTAGTPVDPRLLEGIVFLESAGEPEVIAGGDPAGAAGLTQIEAATGQTLLGMRINLPASRRLTGEINVALSRGQNGRARRLEGQRARADARFDPSSALAATVRYLELADQSFGRQDLAVESYHMGIGNLRSVLDAYDHGAPVPYVQLYFDSAPDRHASAFRLLSSFSDDSWTYLWRVLAAEQIMRSYRRDPSALRALAELQVASGSAAEVLHPPALSAQFADPAAVDQGYANHELLLLPNNPGRLGLAYAPGLGSVARRFGFPAELYRGLRPAALAVLCWIGARVSALSGSSPLTVAGAVSDRRYQSLFGYSDPPAAGGWSFTISRRYASDRQAVAFQAVLDRLQALNLIAWQRYPAEIEVTVAADAGRVLAHGL